MTHLQQAKFFQKHCRHYLDEIERIAAKKSMGRIEMMLYQACMGLYTSTCHLTREIEKNKND